MAFDPNDAEQKKAIKDAVDAAVTEATAGLVAKNAELLGKLKKATKDAQIDPADHQALQAELEATQTKLTETNKTLKAVQADSEKVKKAYESESKVTHTLLVENGLTDSLLKAKVKPELMKAVKAMLSGNVVLVADGESRVAKIGDKTLPDFVSEWAKSDEGKHFVEATQNSGGGANGGGNGIGGAKVLTRAAFEALEPTARMTFTKEGGTLTA